jgi:hypothetical protein
MVACSFSEGQSNKVASFGVLFHAGGCEPTPMKAGSKYPTAGTTRSAPVDIGRGV